MGDIGSKNPTLELREDVVNEVSTGDGQRFFLRALRIDPQTRVLSEVTITDLSRFGEHRLIVARTGEMAFTEDRADLFMTLQGGTAFEISDERPGALQRMEFETLILPMRGVGAELERRIQSGNRGDREMTIPQLNAFVGSQLASMQTLAEESRDTSRQVVQATLGLPLTRSGADLEDMAEATFIGGGYGALEEALSIHRVNEVRWNIHRENVYQYRVEIHKKFAIAFACLIFILLGAPFAVRFPQGGVGMVIATSVGIFFLYWMGLIGGERVAERGLLEPWIAMWLPNVILFVPGFWFALVMGRKLSTNRGGGWEAFRNRVLFRKANQRALRMEETG
jgi:lipopolysaccharide export system permease protein